MMPQLVHARWMQWPDLNSAANLQQGKRMAPLAGPRSLRNRGGLGHICVMGGEYENGTQFINRDHQGIEQNRAHLPAPAACNRARADN
jgi:hypothetical protein